MVRGEHVYLAIDLKSFYASVECHDRGLDPLRTHLVVADEVTLFPYTTLFRSRKSVV